MVILCQMKQNHGSLIRKDFIYAGISAILMEGHITKLIDWYHLPEDADIYLDSIAFQELQEGIHVHSVKSDLGACAAIAERYKKPVEVLKKLDAATATYLKRRSQIGVKCGSFQTLNGRDKNLKKRGDELVLNELDDRIEQCLFGIDKKPEKSGASFEKAVRRHEG